MKWLRIAGLLVIGALLLVEGAPRGQAQEPPPDRRIDIIAERFSFFPSRIRIKRGTTVEFVLMSDDTYHGFHIREGVNTVVPPQGKGEKKIRVLFSQSGEYVFECSRLCGQGHTAMRGLIVVED